MVEICKEEVRSALLSAVTQNSGADDARPWMYFEIYYSISTERIQEGEKEQAEVTDWAKVVMLEVCLYAIGYNSVTWFYLSVKTAQAWSLKL